MKKFMSLVISGLFLGMSCATGAQDDATTEAASNELSLVTETAEEGFQLAVQLARRGVSTTQPDREVLFMLRDVYAKNPEALIASSQVIATYFQTIALANDHWRE